MAKRKSTMKNIIYELDNDDIEISSDDEVSGPKVTRTEPDNDNKVKEVITESDQNGAEVLSVDSTDDSVCVVDSPKRIINGGKTSSDVVGNIGSAGKSPIVENNFQEETEIVCVTKSNSDCENSAIFDEDIVVDSPTDLCVAGCENRMPLVSVRFNNSKVSSSCRDKIKKFMINLIKEHQNDNLTNSDNETDYELDIWPDDLVDAAVEEEIQDVDDGLFFVDTAPSDERNLAADIPKYSPGSSTICNKPEKEKSPPPFFRRGPTCFNCDGAHQLKDCTRPRDNMRIAKMAGQKRNSNTKVGRYHVEDDQKYGHLIPGRISGQLRHALGLKRHELPLFTYRMRLLGYPPGWLEEARISHSGITLFDSTGSATLDPEEEEGEICEARSKDKYDIKKILDFPGFNVPASSRYSEEAHLYGLPPMSEQDSKIAMLQMLAPNAMKAYKRKKLTFFPSAANSSAQEGLAEMELDSGDEETLFPSVPPLPDEAPPPLPPPPEQPPPPPEEPPLPPEDSEYNHEEKNMTRDNNTDKDKINDSDIIEIIEESDATEIPLPDDSFITIDEDYENEETPAVRSSPSIDDLEKQKQVLLEALHSSDVSNTEGNQNVAEQTGTKEQTKEQKTEAPKEDKKPDESQEDKPDKSHDTKKDEPSPADNDKLSEDTNVINSKCESVGTPEPKSGKVKTTSYGTPILNIASSYMKLPSDDKFAKDICDIINFDNLPNSTGKYKQISNLLKKVKTEVDRIQDS